MCENDAKFCCSFVCQEIQNAATPLAAFPLEPELHLENINRLWEKFMTAQQERDLALLAEISRSVEFILGLNRYIGNTRNWADY